MPLAHHYRETRKFVKKIQHADLDVRRTWFFGSTIAAMLFVFLLWAAYLNLNIPSVASSLPPAATSSSIDATSSGATNDAAPSEPTVLSTFGVGLDRIGQGLSDAYRSFSGELNKKFEALKERIGATNSFSIEGTTPNFSWNGIETVPPTHLP